MDAAEVGAIKRSFRFLRRQLVSILFPTLTALVIYSDWSRTQKFKAKKLKEAEEQGIYLYLLDYNTTPHYIFFFNKISNFWPRSKECNSGTAF